MKCATKNFCKSTNRGTEHCAPWLPNRQHKTQQKDVGAFWNSQRSTTPTRTAPHPLLCVTPLCTPAAQHCWQAVQHRGLSTSWTPSRGTALSTVQRGSPEPELTRGPSCISTFEKSLHSPANVSALPEQVKKSKSSKNENKPPEQEEGGCTELSPMKSSAQGSPCGHRDGS